MNTFKYTKRANLLIVAAGVSVAMFAGWNAAFAGVAGSKHDLGSGGASQYAGTAGTAEICVFCHTPHGSDTSAPVPLWNKALPASGSFTAYGSLGTSTYDATQGDIGSVSLACLSCHDGAQAMDSMINAPGSGNYNAAGASAYSLATMNGSPVPNLGTDLRNDHPISMPYAGGLKAAGTSWVAGTGTETLPAAFKDSDFNKVYGKDINSKGAWWVDTAGGTVNVRDKTDMILYTRASGTGTDNAAPTPFVECASCHDPHNSSTAGATSVAFLRIANDNSAVCLACHNK